MKTTKQLYWNAGQGYISETNEHGEAPIYLNSANVYVESYWIEQENGFCIDYAYTQLSRSLGIVDRERTEFFKRHGVYGKYMIMRKFEIPKDKYDELQERYG